jgi:hypothetical protein
MNKYFRLRAGVYSVYNDDRGHVSIARAVWVPIHPSTQIANGHVNHVSKKRKKLKSIKRKRKPRERKERHQGPVGRVNHRVKSSSVDAIVAALIDGGHEAAQALRALDDALVRFDGLEGNDRLDGESVDRLGNRESAKGR